MIRIILLTLVATMASSVTLAAQEKKDPPKDFTNSLGMKFVWIPPGSFMMGSPKEEKERFAHETQHKVTLTKGFYMGVYTVTQEQWREVMGNNPSFFKGEKNLPVEQVSWDDCQEFIKKLREKARTRSRTACRQRRNGNFAAVQGRPRHFASAKRFPLTRPTITATSLTATAKKEFPGGKPRRLERFQRTPGGFTICTAMCGNGARTGTEITRKMT